MAVHIQVASEKTSVPSGAHGMALYRTLRKFSEIQSTVLKCNRLLE